MNPGSLFLLAPLLCTTVFAERILQARMLGGEVVQEGTFPFVASIKQIYNNLLLKSCLGSIIHDEWILSSALCIATNDPGTIVVHLGVYSHSDQPELAYEAAEILLHPDFNSTTGTPDIGLIHLETPITFTPLAQPVPLGDVPFEDLGKVVAIGWNEEPDKGLEPYHLGYIVLDTINVQACQSAFPELDDLIHLDDAHQICTYSGQGKDMCGVDFGGPLIDQQTGRQIGVFNDVIFVVTAHSHQCHPHHDHPLVFTKVAGYMSWISEITGVELSPL